MTDIAASKATNPDAPPPPEVIYVKERRVACNGGGGALGHPKVWYSLEDGEAECGYCDRKFVYNPEKAAS
ncbi:MAG TPA: zinc-finger domain-containing protein [Parvularculaceae bacterium]|jgi:uncharacterized Zn-finger protein|nr:zinc-finger domain-containing protein [Caulobacterales bacterium]HOP20167.1 zinc-finger domain-containing protein [Amphiplicatus sp.]HPE32628.1 zinc-finger domain-containing protein [Parvularculaceae bacterium]HRX40068.1 zinc-finger domain-containing protein [Parvularculaceae bacterium]